MTAADILRTSHLPRPETELLVSFLLGKGREYLLAHPERNIRPALYKKYLNLEKKRLAGWPLAYLTGAKEFYSRSFLVSPAVLVPRPETELMVEKMLPDLQAASRPLVLDLGTGSGAIIVTLAAELRKQSPALFRRTGFLALDLSPRALTVAKANARRHRLNGKISFRQSNLLSSLLPEIKKLNGRQLFVAANLPYLTPVQIKNSPTIQQEPHLALNGGRDGLSLYRRLFQQLQPSNLPLTVFCEIDPGQKDGMRRLAKEYFPGAGVEIKKDLAGRWRLAKIKIPR